VLVIPNIEIQGGRSLRTVANDSSVALDIYSDDPIEMALLWRKENAKSIHVTDYDALLNQSLENLDIVIRMSRTVEVPVQLITRIPTVAHCEELLTGGIYRMILHELLFTDPEGVAALIRRFGPSRICAGAITQSGVLFGIDIEGRSIPTLEFAALAESLGMNRIFFSDREYDGRLRGPNFAELRRLASATNLQITAAGGVASVEHLWMLQEMQPLGIDSVVIGRAFYENRFPCQELWRDIEIERRRDGHNWRDEISTSRLANRPRPD